MLFRSERRAAIALADVQVSEYALARFPVFHVRRIDMHPPRLHHRDIGEPGFQAVRHRLNAVCAIGEWLEHERLAVGIERLTRYDAYARIFSRAPSYASVAC